ncbi:MAG TPA: hypothetical protein VMT49_04965 [Steroidobacteraceae bacterium]|nr:hypothetical protein [Steroidobacteraceae bacterium]
MRGLKSKALLLAGVGLAAVAVRGAEVNDLVREQRVVQVNGVDETWKLEWDRLPASACGPDDVTVALACPCSGFAYGEAGRLSLVRLRRGAAREVLDLTGFFHAGAIASAGGLAVVQRWQPIPASAHDEDDDWHHASDLNFLARVRARPPAAIMRIADYNHDGRASEFLLQVGAPACGQHLMVLVGVSKYNARLHVFASAESPDEPLELDARTWEAVRRSAQPVHAVESGCDQPGAKVESLVTVEPRQGVFHVQRSERACGNPPG